MLLVFSVCRKVLVVGDDGPRKRSAFVASMPVVLAILDRLDLVPSSPERTKLACSGIMYCWRNRFARIMMAACTRSCEEPAGHGRLRMRFASAS